MIDLIALPFADGDSSVFTAFLSQFWLWVKVALGIGFIIFVHELGHFLAAKTFGVKCEKFYVGFDVPIKIGPIKFPRTLGKFQYGETEYGIGILPLGGYVKMLGQDDDPRKAIEEADRIKVDGDGDGDEDEEIELDPRSYPAKPVWQRMIIISAGVIMNVITGILFAAVAFNYGVGYKPAIIGAVTPGGPAWEAGLQPGGQVIEVDGLADDKLHFREMQNAILTASISNPEKPIKVKIKYDDETREVDLLTSPHPDVPEIRMIGVVSPSTTTLNDDLYAAPGTVAEAALTDEDAGGKIVAFDGTPVDEDSIVPSTKFLTYLYTNPTKDIDLQIKRTDDSMHNVTLPAQPRHTIGIEFGIGPVCSIVKGGPAEKAGLQMDDKIISVDGINDFDAFNLPVQLASVSSEVNLTVERGEEQVELSMTPEQVLQPTSPISDLGGGISVSSLGFAYKPATTAQGSSLIAGDVVKELSLLPKQEVLEEIAETRADLLAELEEIQLGDSASVTRLYQALQALPVGTKFKLFFESGSDGKISETTVTIQQDENHFRFERGLVFTAVEKIHIAETLGESMSLGVREAKRRCTDVFRFLGLVFRGKVSRKHVGGPIKIVQIAGMEAKQGISKQLMFLTLLSMNLAILNFLPIPALDGGHMVFLTAELIRGKRVDEQLEMKLTMAGVLMLLALMAFVFLNDILTF